MGNEVVVKVANASKKFSRTLRHVMLYGGMDIARNALGMSAHPEKLRDGEFWAVDDVSFELERGETLGVVGSNGSGKTTLLKLINGIFMPDKGRLELKGRIGALIELGAGFHPMLTGRENIYINGTILGLNKKEIDEKFDEIVEFSELEEFLDAPVRSYSSGMFAKLGFSVAVHVDPDILLVDEVLSVGDIRFQNASYQKITEIKDKATTVFVSHNLGAVSVLCDRVIWLDHGRIRMFGDTQEVIGQYSKSSMLELLESGREKQDENVTFSGDIMVLGVDTTDAQGNVKEIFGYGEDLVIRCHYKADKPLGKPFFQFDIRSPKSGVVFGSSMIADGFDRREISEGAGTVACHFKGLPLQAGLYAIDVNIRPELGLGKLFRQLTAASFNVESAVEQNWTGKLAKFREMYAGPVLVPYEWRYDKSK